MLSPLLTLMNRIYKRGICISYEVRRMAEVSIRKILRETEKAYLVFTLTNSTIWLPKSQTKILFHYSRTIKISVPDWLYYKYQDKFSPPEEDKEEIWPRRRKRLLDPSKICHGCGAEINPPTPYHYYHGEADMELYFCSAQCMNKVRKTNISAVFGVMD